MTPEPILLESVLREHRLLRYGSFRAAYDKTAASIDERLTGSAPSRAQFHRWVTGGLKRLPYTDHCRVLETMFPKWTAEQLFAPSSTAGPVLAPVPDRADLEAQADRLGISGLAGVTAVFPTRAEFAFSMPPHTLFGEAEDVRAAGLSLNLLCQQYPDQRILQAIERCARFHCLFLDPAGKAITARETLIDDRLCVMQPYLPQARGVDSPTFVIENTPGQRGLYATFEHIFAALSERSRPL